MSNKADKQPTAELWETAEYHDLQKATNDFTDWLSGVCAFLKCCALELDWAKLKTKGVVSLPSEIPERLLAFASE